MIAPEDGFWIEGAGEGDDEPLVATDPVVSDEDLAQVVGPPDSNFLYYRDNFFDHSTATTVFFIDNCSC